VGHVGLFRFDFVERTVEIDNIVRGAQGLQPGIMFLSVQSLLGWAFEKLGMSAIFLRVFSDNERAIQLYRRCGFMETMRMPLARVEKGDVTTWVEVAGDHRKLVTRYFVTMRLMRCDYLPADGLPRP
jgi:RimJ/RimL family protein N-acetyltransferase